jgi:hypothetical protein
MMDLLKRFEEDSLIDDPFTNPETSDDEGGGDGDDADDLERRLANIDLGEFCYSLLPCIGGSSTEQYLSRECFRG